MIDASMRILGVLDIDLLRASIETVVRRHESLRTRITLVDSIPRQCIDEVLRWELEVVDLSDKITNNIESEAKHLLEDFEREKIVLSEGPLFSAKLLKLSKHDHVLMLGVDHIVSDAISCVIMREEILTAYKKSAQGLPIPLPNLPVQFADYAVWQQKTLNAWREKHESYWRSRLVGAPHVELPTDRHSSTENTFTWTIAEFPLGDKVSVGLHDLAWQERTLLPLAVLTVVVAVTSVWCNKKDFVVTFVSHGRHGQPQLANMIGILSDPLRLRIEIAERSSLLDLLKGVIHEFSAAHEHLGLNRLSDLIPTSSIPICFNWISNKWTQRFEPFLESTGQIDAQPFSLQQLQGPLSAPMRNMIFEVWPSDAGEGTEIVIRVRYQTEAFSLSTMQRLGRNLQLFAESLIDYPSTLVSSLRFSP